MALRIHPASVSSLEIDNRDKGKTIVLLRFTDGFTSQATLQGNPWRDVAGRVTSLENQSPDPDRPHTPDLPAEDHGHTGDITASRKIKELLTPLDEPLPKSGPPPFVWKNSLYLEWFSTTKGRVVLEATDFQSSLGEAAWTMTPEEEIDTREQAQEAMEKFMSQLGDLEASRSEVDRMTEGKDELDEFEWEKLMKHSDQVTDRYMELLDKYGDDDDTIDQLMGWKKPTEDNEPPEHSAETYEIEWPDEDDLDDDWMETPTHPLRTMAEELLDQMGSRKDSFENDEMSDLWFSVANIGAKLAGAMSGYHGDGTFDDNGFAIAQLKRVLALINEATPTMQRLKPDQLPELLKIRHEIIDLQQSLRRRS
ncbi:hypothetical protein JO972_15475 [Verrucomicrobiaceae bacterium 5K15]|uniref:Uncharacterized protein n=1 Tax=Oceaniferula flava TaxID=2800421 RepID=A0AAE2SHB9_9BACT|nr:hypothetical protein [Oceaniferula flavus]MBK1856371.1 hypothetical protein [Oceaniferula flavus]MBM1137678.1 hypothetical protein [Oceaniferula flavus]